VSEDFGDGPFSGLWTQGQSLLVEPFGQGGQFPGSGLLQAHRVLAVAVIEHALGVLLGRLLHGFFLSLVYTKHCFVKPALKSERAPPAALPLDCEFECEPT